MKATQFVTLIAATATLLLGACTKEDIAPEGLTPFNEHATAKLIVPTDNSDDKLPPKNNPDRAIGDHEAPVSNFQELPESKEGNPKTLKTPGYNPQGNYEQVGDPSTLGDVPGEAQEEADKEGTVSILRARQIISRNEVEIPGNDQYIDPFTR